MGRKEIIVRTLRGRVLSHVKYTGEDVIQAAPNAFNNLIDDFLDLEEYNDNNQPIERRHFTDLVNNSNNRRPVKFYTGYKNDNLHDANNAEYI